MNDGLNVEREVFVPAELVFEVWTRPEHLAGWYPGDGEQLDAAAQPGGFDLLRTADGRVLETIEQIHAEPSRSLRWRVQRDGAALTLEVGFAGGGGTCTLSVHLRGFSGATERDRQNGIWNRRLERLEAYFSVI